MKKKSKIIIIGYGGHARSCIEAIKSSNKFQIIGYIDKKKNKENIFNLDYLGDDNQLPELRKISKNAFISIGQIKDNKPRKIIYKKLKKLEFNLPIIIASTAYLSNFVEIGEGTIIMHNTFLNSNVKIGTNNIINTGTIIEHDARIGNDNHISTSVVVNGNVSIGNNNFIGSNTVVNNNVKIKNNRIIKSMSRIYT
tara:strand:+ start:8569 stop:9156 length:588 start_codon:yes stop_codon:yes gene_type:complete